MSSGSLSELTWEEYKEKLREKSVKDNTPYCGNLELTPRCNFNCKMCYVHLTDAEAKKIGSERTAGEWIEIGKQFCASGGLMVLLTGGEVFLRPDFREIYEAFSEMGLVVTIFSNGYLIDDGILSWLSKRPPMLLRITMYGASNETYEKITGVKSAFDRVVRNIDMILGSGIPLSLAATIVNENSDDLDAIRKIAEDRDIAFTYTKNIVKPVRGANFKGGVTQIDQVEVYKNSFGSRVEKIKDVSDDPFSSCRLKGCGFWLTWDGKLSACSFIEAPHTYPFETGFAKAWEELQKELKQIKKPGKCLDCKYAAFCLACPGVLSAETGRPDQINDSICEKARSLYEAYSVSYMSENAD